MFYQILQSTGIVGAKEALIIGLQFMNLTH
jgi:hypothetical protein